MITEKAFDRLLGLIECWKVVGAEYEEEDGGCFLSIVRETATLWPTLRCPESNYACDGITCYDHAPARIWRQLDVFGKKT